jgi:hypothetical protein
LGGAVTPRESTGQPRHSAKLFEHGDGAPI